MARRLLAAGAGGLVGFGIFSVLGFGTVGIQAVQMPPAAIMASSAAGELGTRPLPAPAPPEQADATPRQLVISSIGVDARVEARGLDSGRNLASPNDYRDVAWYDAGPRPGEPGNAILNGHVGWWTGDAVFTHLSRLRPGDLIRVVRADGSVVTFKVSSTRVVDANARIASLFTPSTRATLTLITCTGMWNPLTQSDTNRLLVSAVLA